MLLFHRFTDQASNYEDAIDFWMGDENKFWTELNSTKLQLFSFKKIIPFYT